MSKDYSHLFSGTSGSKHSYSEIKTYSKGKLTSWAKKQQEGMSGKQKQKFNTACVVYDETTGKCYYGRNAELPKIKDGKLTDLSKLHPDLQKLLPKKKKGKFELGNCAEVAAVDKALKAGAKLKNLHMTTIYTNDTKDHSFGDYKGACKNCKKTFKWHVKKNYSGWNGEK